MDLDINPFNIHNLSSRNVLLGKNGCGKSHVLKHLHQKLRGREGFGTVRYVSPERGGLLNYEANIEQSIANDVNWIGNVRNRNQSENFRQQSVTLFRRLEMMVLREIEREHQLPGYVPKTFQTTIESLNTLLDRVSLQRDNAKGFLILDRQSGQPVGTEAVSSGESELISLGIEFLAFAKEAVPDRVNLLLVDEPDVHLHPDLQDRLSRFLLDCFRDTPVTIILATHSTALLGGLAEDPDTHVAFMRRGGTDLHFDPVTAVDRAILPIFGAHPLSNIFNQAPILLVEGEDDERIWQQAVRSANGAIRLYPCVVEGIGGFTEYETEVNNIIESVYDDAIGYSLRDRDLDPEEIDDIGHISRMRLSCRAAENLMLSDDVLRLAGVDWTALQERINTWIATNVSHQYFGAMHAFVQEGCIRKDHDLKPIRNILIGLMSNKAWEVLVGQAIARLARREAVEAQSENSLSNYLGQKVCQELLGLAQ